MKYNQPHWKLLVNVKMAIAVDSAGKARAIYSVILSMTEEMLCLIIEVTKNHRKAKTNKQKNCLKCNV